MYWEGARLTRKVTGPKRFWAKKMERNTHAESEDRERKNFGETMKKGQKKT